MRSVVRAGLLFTLVAIVVLIGTIDPQLDGFKFSAAMALLGVGMGLLASQLGNAVQSSVGDEDRSEAGGLQWTTTQLGSALGVAVIGSVVLTGLTGSFVDAVSADPSIPADVRVELVAAAGEGVDFVASSDVNDALVAAGVDQPTTDVIVGSYEDSQLLALKAGLLGAAFLAVFALFATSKLPSTLPEESTAESGPADTVGDLSVQP